MISLAGFTGEIMIVVITTLVVFAALYFAWDEISFARAEKESAQRSMDGIRGLSAIGTNGSTQFDDD
jgi:hypothetical protein